MNTYAKIAVAAAAVLIVAFVGYNCCRVVAGGTGGPAPSPSSIATTLALVRAVTERIRRRGLRQRTGCPSAFPAGPVTSTVFTPRLSYTAPAG